MYKNIKTKMKKRLLVVGFYLLFGVFFSGLSFDTVSAQEVTSTPRYTFTFDENFDRDGLRDLEVGDEFSGVLFVNLIDDVPSRFSVRINDTSTKAKVSSEIDVLSMVTWFEFPSSSSVVFETAGTKAIPFKIRVPEGVSPGDYSANISVVLDQFGEDVLIQQELGVDEIGIGAKFSVAVAVELIARVNGDVTNYIDLKDFSYAGKMNNAATFIFEYENLGTIAVAPNVELFIRDMFGNPLLNESYKMVKVLPGTTESFSLNILESKFNPDAFGIHSVNAEIFYNFFNFVKYGDEVQKVFLASSKLTIYSLPEPVVFTFLIVFILIAIVYLIMQSLNFKKVYSAKVYQVLEGESLESVSKKFMVDPRKVIKINLLKSPFYLQGGQHLLISPKHEK